MNQHYHLLHAHQGSEEDDYHKAGRSKDTGKDKADVVRVRRISQRTEYQ